MSWFDAAKSVICLSEHEGLEPVYVLSNPRNNKSSEPEYDVSWNREATGHRFRTAAEWKCADRGGEEYGYAGSDNIDEVGRFDENPERELHPVRQNKPTGHGLYEMSENSYEWCWDWFDYEDYPEGSRVDPVGPEGEGHDGRVMRGGNWRFDTAESRVVFRASWSVDHLVPVF